MDLSDDDLEQLERSRPPDLVKMPYRPVRFSQMALSEQPPQSRPDGSRTPPIRGEDRQALVEALALAEKTYPELAAEFGRTVQAVHQFSARNHAEIATRRQTLLGQVDAEGAHLWVSHRVVRRAWRQKLLEDIEARLADPDLDDRQRSRLIRDAAMLLHQVDEEKGELPPRTSKVEIRSLMPLGSRLVMTDDGQFHEMAE